MHGIQLRFDASDGFDSSLNCRHYDFVEIIKLYYYKQKSWEQEVFVSRLKNKIELDDFRVELVKRILK